MDQESVDQRKEQLRQLLEQADKIGWGMNQTGSNADPPEEVTWLDEIQSYTAGGHETEEGFPRQISINVKRATVGRTYDRMFAAIPWEHLGIVRDVLLHCAKFAQLLDELDLTPKVWDALKSVLGNQPQAKRFAAMTQYPEAYESVGALADKEPTDAKA